MIVCLNGELVDRADARVSVFDRGFLFGDGVYEGLRAEGGRIIAMDAHIDRMRAGLAAMRIDGFDPDELRSLTTALLGANKLEHAFVYWQVTRGTPGPGDVVRHRTPGGYKPTIMGFTTPLPSIESLREPPTRAVSLLPDTRWTRGRIKCISLAGGVLAAVEAGEQDAEDAILERDGRVTEGTSANVLIVRNGRVATPDLAEGDILEGVTRTLLLDAMPEIEVRDFSADELRSADEIALCGTVTMITAVTRLDGAPVGDGRPGPATTRLHEALKEAIRRDLAQPALD